MRRWIGAMIGAAMLASVAVSVPAHAAWRMVDAGESRKVARSDMVVTAPIEWNRSTDRPTRRTPVWTIDGQSLNDLTFFMGVKKGDPLFRERDKKRNPLPKFDPRMLPTDIVEMFEDTANIVLGGSLFRITDVRPAQLAGYDGVHFAFEYTGGDNVERKGEVRGAIIGDRLYLISFDAPQLYYFDRYITGVHSIMDGARFAD